MMENSEIENLKQEKSTYLRIIENKGKMTSYDADKLKMYDYEIFLAKHPLIKKFNKYLHPEPPAQRDKNTVRKDLLKRAVRFAITFPVAIPHNLFLNTAASYWRIKNMVHHDPNRKNKNSLLLNETLSNFTNYGHLDSATLERPLAAVEAKQTKTQENEVTGPSKSWIEKIATFKPGYVLDTVSLQGMRGIGPDANTPPPPSQNKEKPQPSSQKKPLSPIMQRIIAAQGNRPK